MKYKNLKLNPNNYKRNVVNLRCLEEDYEKIRDMFNSIFVTARLFDYKINLYRSKFFSKCIFLSFEQKRYFVSCEIHHINNKIAMIRIEKQDKEQKNTIYQWRTIENFYYNNEKLPNKTDEELLSEILKFL